MKNRRDEFFSFLELFLAFVLIVAIIVTACVGG